MTDLNKGRFKSADEALAVWNLFIQIYSIYDINAFKKGDLIAEHCVSLIAKELYKARLINGSIYDEHGRVEDKDVAYYVVQRSIDIQYLYIVPAFAPNFDRIANKMLKKGEIQGTIFY